MYVEGGKLKFGSLDVISAAVLSVLPPFRYLPA